MQTPIRALMAALVLLVPGIAPAGPSYNYVEAGYTYFDPDDFSSADGFGVAGSLALLSTVHLVADYDRITGSGATAHFNRVAIGMNSHIDHRSDFIARVGYIRSRAGRTDEGFLAEVGARGIFFDRLELDTFITYVDDSLFGQDLQFSVGAVYGFTDRFGLSLRGDWSTERVRADLRLRYRF